MRKFFETLLALKALKNIDEAEIFQEEISAEDIHLQT